jgi:hypothetical protein
MSTVTEWPFAVNSRTSVVPTKPVPPVMKILID